MIPWFMSTKDFRARLQILEDDLALNDPQEIDSHRLPTWYRLKRLEREFLQPIIDYMKKEKVEMSEALDRLNRALENIEADILRIQSDCDSKIAALTAKLTAALADAQGIKDAADKAEALDKKNEPDVGGSMGGVTA